jgi:hypothetical protein
MRNYKSVSLTTSSKILKTLTFNRLNQYLQAKKTFVPEQFGFWKGNTI